MSIVAKAKNAEGMSVSQYGDPDYIRFVSHSTNRISSEEETISTEYKCIRPGSNISFGVAVEEMEINKKVTCRF